MHTAEHVYFVLWAFVPQCDALTTAWQAAFCIALSISKYRKDSPLSCALATVQFEGICSLSLRLDLLKLDFTIACNTIVRYESFTKPLRKVMSRQPLTRDPVL